MFTNVCIERKLNTQTAKLCIFPCYTPPQKIELTLAKWEEKLFCFGGQRVVYFLVYLNFILLKGREQKETEFLVDDEVAGKEAKSAEVVAVVNDFAF